MAAWQTLGGGWPAPPTQDDRDGVGYVVKGLGCASEAEMSYEFQKFGSRYCDLMLSNSFWRTQRRVILPSHKTERKIR